MERIISIIIPVYNTKAFIQKCIKSCFDQSYHNIEIIAVNDGSTDGSDKILDELAKKDRRLKVIHKKNEGVSRTRFLGVENSVGDFLFFLDSDDWLEKSIIEELLYTALSEEADIVASGFYSVLNNKRSIGEKYESKNISVEEFLSLFLTKKMQGGLWAKLFKKSFWPIKEKDIEFKIKNNEDYLILVQAALNAKVITLSESIGYNYLKREGSASNNTEPSIAYDVLKVTSSIISIMEKQVFFNKIKNELSLFCATQLTYAIINNTFCYKNPRFVTIYHLGQNSIYKLEKKKHRMVLFSYKYGEIAFLLIAYSFSFWHKLKSKIKSKIDYQ